MNKRVKCEKDGKDERTVTAFLAGVGKYALGAPEEGAKCEDAKARVESFLEHMTRDVRVEVLGGEGCWGFRSTVDKFVEAVRERAGSAYVDGVENGEGQLERSDKFDAGWALVNKRVLKDKVSAFFREFVEELEAEEEEWVEGVEGVEGVEVVEGVEGVEGALEEK